MANTPKYWNKAKKYLSKKDKIMSKLIKKYKEQQMNVKNNREYDAISKEVESQELDTKIFAKKSTENELYKAYPYSEYGHTCCFRG